MPEQKVYPILLEQSINTDSPDYDVKPLDATLGPAPHLLNSGIERNGGVRQVYEVKYTKAANEIVQYTKSGKRVSIASTGAVTVDGVSVGSIDPMYQAFTETAPGDYDDVLPLSTGIGIVGFKTTGYSTSVIEKWTYSNGVWTKDVASIVNIARGFADWDKATMVRPIGMIVTGTDSIPFLCCISGTDLYIHIIATDSSLFSSFTATAAGDYIAIANGSTNVVIVQLDSPNTWVWTSTGPTLTALPEYGYPSMDDNTGADTICVFRTPTLANREVAKVITLTTSAIATYFVATTITAIYYTNIGFGRVYISAEVTGGSTPVQTSSWYRLNGSIFARQINTTRSYLTEIIGVLYDSATAGIGMYYVNGAPSHLGYYYHNACIDGAHGAPLSEIGTIDRIHFPAINNAGGIVYKEASGKFKYTYISSTQTYLTPTLVDDEVVYVNSISGKNIIRADLLTVEYGPTAYNGSIVIAVPSASPGVSLSIASRVENEYGGGVDIGEKIITGVGTLAANRYYTPGQNPIPLNGKYKFNVYENGTYYKSLTGHVGGTGNDYLFAGSIDSILYDTVYVQGTLLPTISKSDITEDAIVLNGKTVLRNTKSVGYDLGNEIPISGRAFRLFGTRYLFDGEDIFTISVNQAGIVQAYDLQARAQGLTYLCVTPTEAWFFSSWDYTLWTFNGGRNVELKYRLNAKTTIVGGAFCVAANELILYETAGKSLYIRNGIITETTLGVTATGALSLQVTKDGTWVVPQGGAGNISRLQYSSTGGTIVPLEFQTAFQGQGANLKHTDTGFIFTLFDAAKAATTFTVTWYGINEDGIMTSETRTFTPVWDANGLSRIRFIPSVGNVIASSVKVYANRALTILDATRYASQDGSGAVIQNVGA